MSTYFLTSPIIEYLDLALTNLASLSLTSFVYIGHTLPYLIVYVITVLISYGLRSTLFFFVLALIFLPSNKNKGNVFWLLVNLYNDLYVRLSLMAIWISLSIFCHLFYDFNIMNFIIHKYYFFLLRPLFDLGRVFLDNRLTLLVKPVYCENSIEYVPWHNTAELKVTLHVIECLIVYPKILN